MGKRTRMLLVVAAFSLLFSTSLFWVFEHAANPEIHNLFDVVWWWVVTSATVGYGDIVPLTTPGRVISIFAILTGFFLYANFVALIAESVHAYLERHSRGWVPVKQEHHVVICEYTSVADELIQSLPESPLLRDKPVVIVTDMVLSNPYPRHSFVFGVPINPQVLKKASIEKADIVFVFANLRFADPDVKTMHVAARIMRLNPTARIFVEMVNPQSDLLEDKPENIVVMDSRRLIKRIIRHQSIRPEDFLESKPEN